ncbi:MAG: hypothetical protein AVDCRST_MAG88-111 [uncultured Thermomicrobiales bacterium]|uniref:Uncharacterized protein n=1 Tax=uncultured Thermomicrobiales bacterium TaxID=1645740 RepID=A0A6J4UA67_9BACT|nr:MAG: hypothetical protein AVDCRST_MAG88-111 [uncultured Thermomicrobiales bacterium]
MGPARLEQALIALVHAVAQAVDAEPPLLPAVEGHDLVEETGRPVVLERPEPEVVILAATQRLVPAAERQECRAPVHRGAGVGDHRAVVEVTRAAGEVGAEEIAHVLADQVTPHLINLHGVGVDRPEPRVRAQVLVAPRDPVDGEEVVVIQIDDKLATRRPGGAVPRRRHAARPIVSHHDDAWVVGGQGGEIPRGVIVRAVVDDHVLPGSGEAQGSHTGNRLRQECSPAVVRRRDDRDHRWADHGRPPRLITG